MAKKKEPKYNEACGIHFCPLKRKKAADGGTEIWCTDEKHGFYAKIQQRYEG